MYKLPLKIGGVLISIILFILASMEYTDYEFEEKFSSNYNAIYYDGETYSYNQRYYDYFFTDVETEIDNETAAIIDVIYKDDHKNLEVNMEIYYMIESVYIIALYTAGAIIFLISMCIKTPYDKKILELLKRATKSDKKTKNNLCKSCGAKLSKGTKFCPNCGAVTSAETGKLNDATVHINI